MLLFFVCAQLHYISVDILKKLFHLGLFTDVGFKAAIPQWLPPADFIHSVVANIKGIIQISRFANNHEMTGRYNCRQFIQVCFPVI